MLVMVTAPVLHPNFLVMFAVVHRKSEDKATVEAKVLYMQSINPSTVSSRGAWLGPSPPVFLSWCRLASLLVGRRLRLRLCQTQKVKSDMYLRRVCSYPPLANAGVFVCLAAREARIRRSFSRG